MYVGMNIMPFRAITPFCNKFTFDVTCKITLNKFYVGMNIIPFRALTTFPNCVADTVDLKRTLFVSMVHCFTRQSSPTIAYIV